jgi:hypothetical protein
MELHNILHTPAGKIFISIILGIGLASLFQKVCTDKKCIDFRGPVLPDFQQQIFQYGNKCYQYRPVAGKCDSMKQIIDVDIL